MIRNRVSCVKSGHALSRLSFQAAGHLGTHTPIRLLPPSSPKTVSSCEKRQGKYYMPIHGVIQDWQRKIEGQKIWRFQQKTWMNSLREDEDVPEWGRCVDECTFVNVLVSWVISTCKVQAAVSFCSCSSSFFMMFKNKTPSLNGDVGGNMFVWLFLLAGYVTDKGTGGCVFAMAPFIWRNRWFPLINYVSSMFAAFLVMSLFYLFYIIFFIVFLLFYV